MTESAPPPPTRPRWVLPVLIGTVVLVLLGGAAFATFAITSLANETGEQRGGIIEPQVATVPESS